MKIKRTAALAASFALTASLTVACINSNADTEPIPVGGYQVPSTSAASLAEAPVAPKLQGASCGTIGPEEATVSITDEANALNGAQPLTTVKADGIALLNGFNIAALKGKLTEQALGFLESLQNVARKQQATVVVPSGYSVVQKPLATVSPMVLK